MCLIKALSIYRVDEYDRKIAIKVAKSKWPIVSARIIMLKLTRGSPIS